MVEIKGPAVTATERLRQDADKIPEFEHVEWRKDPALRRLYIFSIFGLMVASATTGYDG
jgi:hypothetical protein